MPACVAAHVAACRIARASGRAASQYRRDIGTLFITRRTACTEQRAEATASGEGMALFGALTIAAGLRCSASSGCFSRAAVAVSAASAWSRWCVMKVVWCVAAEGRSALDKPVGDAQQQLPAHAVWYHSWAARLNSGNGGKVSVRSAAL